MTRWPGPSTAGRLLRRGPLLVVLGMAAGLGASDVSAAPVGNFAASTGLLATLLAMFAMKGWPGVASVSTVSSAGSALIIAAAMAWLLPSRRRHGPAAVRLGRIGAIFGRASRLAPGESVEGRVLEADLADLFRRVQRAWDLAEWGTLEALMTTEMLAECRREREHCVAGGARGRTDVVAIEVELIGDERVGSDSMLGVVFSGRFREAEAGTDLPFREIWMLTRSDAVDARWKLARHQSLY